MIHSKCKMMLMMMIETLAWEGRAYEPTTHQETLEVYLWVPHCLVQAILRWCPTVTKSNFLPSLLHLLTL